MSVLIGIFVASALVFLCLGYRWESTLKRPKINGFPLVSILIPAYNSEKFISKSIKSVLNIDYPKKEVIVANDSVDNTPRICKQLGVKCIQNKTRLGKASSLNNAVKYANGRLLYFLDADTIARKDSLKKLVPWFNNKKVAVVVPKYIAHNPKTFTSKLVSIENHFIASLIKINMYFGSMVTFRGCGVLIKKSIFEKLGGWPKTQTEDNDFAGLVIRRGYKVQYEPDAIVETVEAENLSELKKQRIRWGKGVFYTFCNHKSGYKSIPSFLFFTLTYLFLGLCFLIYTIFQVNSFIPAFSIFLTSSSYQQLAAVFLLVIPAIISFFATIAISTISHITLLTIPEKSEIKDLVYIIPYTLFYIPATLYFYAKGAYFGMKDKMKNRDQLDFDNW